MSIGCPSHYAILGGCPSYYAILEVSETASTEEIGTAYRNKALLYHPDKAVQNKLTFEVATEKFKEINEAYATLSDPENRKLYDISRVRHEESGKESVPVPATTTFDEEHRCDRNWIIVPIFLCVSMIILIVVLR